MAIGKNILLFLINVMQLFLLLKLCIITRWGYNTPPDSPRNIKQLRYLVPELDIYAIPSQEGKLNYLIVK